MKSTANQSATTLLWLTDLHLDRVGDSTRTQFLSSLSESAAEVVVITGDISVAKSLPGHLFEIGQACFPCPVYFVLGNHDFFGSRFSHVDQSVEVVCKQQKNLHHLGHGERISLGNNSALIGHRGWADGRAGWGARSVVRNPDGYRIADFRGLSKRAAFGLMGDLGKTSGKYFRDMLPYALKCNEHLWIATHVPPFPQAAFYNGKPCDWLRQPYYSNISAGGVIKGIATKFPDRRVTILCGHTHSGANVKVGDNVTVRAGRSRIGRPEIQEIFFLN